MLSTVHEILRQVIYTGGGISPDEVDVRFEPPTRGFIDGLSRPTISLVPIDFFENLELGRADFQVRRGDRHVETAVPPRRIDVRYMATALTTDVADEHELVWRVLAALLRTPEVPRELLPEHIRAFNLPVPIKAAHGAEELKLLDVWGNLSVEPHAAFSCVVTLPMDAEQVVRSPLVLTRTARYRRRDAEDAEQIRTHIGGVVHDARGRPLAGAVVALDGSARSAVSDAQGHFVLPGVPTGLLTLHVVGSDSSVSNVDVEVPEGPYDVVLK